MNIIKRIITGGLLLLIAAIITTGCSKEPSTENFTADNSLFEEISKQDLTRVTIRTDLNKLIANKEEEAYQEAVFSWKDVKGIEHTFDMKVSSRGNSRKRYCDFPPLKINFSKKDLNAKGFSDYDKLKLVTHCIDDETLVLKEYLAYQLYHELTDQSFRSHLIKVVYEDLAGESTPMESYAILLEPKEELADRIGGLIHDNDQSTLKTIDADQYRLLTLFQYMIGNTDWNLSRQHNIKLLTKAQGTAPIPVPYDFDHAGLVNAPYAKPHPQLPISEVTDRFFQWRGKTAEGMDETIQVFQNNKEDLLKLCHQMTLLDHNSKTETIEYLHSFFHLLDQVTKSKDLLVITGLKGQPLS